MSTFYQFQQNARSQDGKLDYINAHYDTILVVRDMEPENNENLLSPLRNALVETINQQLLLPKAIILVLDDDMLDELDHYKTGITTSIGQLVEWLANQLHRIITNYKEAMPSKSHKFRYPTLLWCLIPQHTVYDQYNGSKAKFNKSVLCTIQLFHEMTALELTLWKEDNLDYCENGTLSATGLTTYWQAINRAFELWDWEQMKQKTQQGNCRGIVMPQSH